jgi:azurin
MKKITVCILVVFAFLFSCKKSDGNQNSQKESIKIPKEDPVATIPGIENMTFTDSIKLTAGEDMRFDKELFRVKRGKKITLTFKNLGPKTGMVHNVVVLTDDLDLADFGDEASKAKDKQYIPLKFSKSIIAHTGMVSGQESETIEFTLREPGVFDFICSFPGHWGTMQGKIVAE